MPATVFGQITQVNPHEWLYFAAHPYHAYAISQAFIKSVRETDKRFPINGLNDESDAFRHCLWSAFLTRDIGYFSALQFTTIHEWFPSNHQDEKEMDLHNNRIGMLIGRTGGSDVKLAQNCMAALVSGQLKTLIKGSTP
jgi:hypothetical protein